MQGQAPPLKSETLHALFADHLQRQRAVILLDGLDEITDPGERNEIVRAIEGLATECEVRTELGAESKDLGGLAPRTSRAGVAGARTTGSATITTRLRCAPWAKPTGLQSPPLRSFDSASKGLRPSSSAQDDSGRP